MSGVLTKLVMDPVVNIAAPAGTFLMNVVSVDDIGAVIAAVVTPTTHTSNAAVATVAYAAGVLTITGVGIGEARVWLDKSGVISNKVLVRVANAALGPSAHSAVGHHGAK